jgi:CubicO group peptidase (beta-lactamase class C family)
MKYDQFVQERILDRVGMRDSGFDDMHKIVIHRARGYALVHGDLENADPIDAGASAWSAGAFYSTLRDLTLWSEALAHGKVLNADSTARMCHGGGIKGFNSVLQRYPEANVLDRRILQS